MVSLQNTNIRLFARLKQLSSGCCSPRSEVWFVTPVTRLCRAVRFGSEKMEKLTFRELTARSKPKDHGHFKTKLVRKDEEAN